MVKSFLIASILFVFNSASANILTSTVTAEPAAAPAPAAVHPMSHKHPDFDPTVTPRTPGDHHPPLPISFQNGNCVAGQPCPGAPTPRRKPCSIDDSQPHCGGHAIEVDRRGSKDETKDEEKNEDPDHDDGPTGPTPACQNAVAQINQCSQVPQVNAAVPRGNILGNYDAATATLRGSSNTLSGYSSQCQSLMGQCASRCSGSNPFDKSLKNQCYKYQGQVSQARSEAQHLNNLSLQTELAAQQIRLGESGFRNDTNNIGAGQGLAKKTPKKLSAEQTRIQQVAELLAKRKMEGFSQSVDGASIKEKDKVDKLKHKQPAYLVATARPIYKDKKGNHFPRPSGNSVDKSDEEEVAENMHKGFYKASLKPKKKRKIKRDKPDPHMSASQLALRKKGKGLTSPEEILARQLREKQRNLASQRGLTRRDRFIFNSICVKYDSFERAFGINLGSTQCPPAN